MSAVATREGSEFTDYDGFTVEYRDASHRYWIIKDGERISVPSVTGVEKVLAKDALIPWAEKMGVEGALRLERAGQLNGIAIKDAVYAMRTYGEGASAKRDAGADRGTAIHDALRFYCEAGAVPNVGDFDESVRGYVQALCKWLLKTAPEPVLVENVVGSWTHGFAGRFDLLATIDGDLVLVDLKTSSGSARVFKEAHLQVAGYELALEECELQKPARTLIVALGEDGSVRAVPARGSASDFLAVLACDRALKALQSTLRADEKAAA